MPTTDPVPTPPQADVSPPTTESIRAAHDRAMTHNYPRFPIVMARGENAWLWYQEGRRYLDLFAGFGASILGHAHPELVRAVTEQAGKLWHPGNLFHTEPQTRAADAIRALGFNARCYFGHSGADANEAAIKLARLYGRSRPGRLGPRYAIVSTHRSFHGRSFGTMPATGASAVREGFAPLPEGFRHVPYNDLDALREAIDPNTVAVIVEPIQGEGGVNVPRDDYLPGVRALCDEHDLLMICDEVWTGCGRTGRNFGHQHWEVEPDVMTLGKGVGGGMPFSVMAARDPAAKLFDFEHVNRVVHASTLGGACLPAAAGAAVLETIARDGLTRRAAELGDRVRDRIAAHASPYVREVRGRGLMLGVELKPEARGAWFDSAGDVVHRCREAGVLLNATQKVVLRLAPPITIEAELLDRGIDAMLRVLAGQPVEPSLSEGQP